VKILYHPVFLEHATGSHPENKNRLLAFPNLPITDILSGEKYLTLYHTHNYVRSIKEASKQAAWLDPDTVISKGSYYAAVAAVGATIMASQSGDFALVRPPGHHAHPNRASGFCLFNNIDIAAQRLVNQGKRVMIFDFDGHLGDGTEEFFYESDNVFYWSIHEEHAFPGGGTIGDIGEGKGTGYTINVPIPAGTGDDVYKEIIQTLLPVALQFAPDVVGVSAGFDGHHADPLLGLNLTVNIYYEIGLLLRKHFRQIFAVLEGGYNTIYLPQCTYNFIAGINGDKKTYSESEIKSSVDIRQYVGHSILQLKKILSGYWKI